MKPKRARQLLLGHALAEGTSVEAAIRESGAPFRGEDLLLAQAGRLEDALLRMGFDAPEARLAAAWPACLRPAQRRLASLPSPRGLQAQLLQVLVYVIWLLTAQAILLSVLVTKVVPTLAAMETELGEVLGHVHLLDGLLAATSLSVPFLGAALLAILALPRRLPAWGRQMVRAEEAARAAALLESGAPEDVRAAAWRGFRRLRGQFATAQELDLVLDRAIADATAAQARLVAVVRSVGLGLCVAVGAVTTGVIYHFISRITV